MKNINIKDQAFADYQKGMKYKDIAKKYGVSLSAVKSWAARYWKKEGCDQKEKRLQPKQRKDATRGAPEGNRNAVGNRGGALPGNKNAVKHGAYETIYYEALPAGERSLFASIADSDELDGEIRLLRFKLARLIGRGEITTYDMFGGAHKRVITEAEREKGILEITAEIRKLIKTKKQIELAEWKAGTGKPDENGDDGFLDALQSNAEEDWADEGSGG